MTIETALAFVAALLVWIVIPGPAILMIVGRSLSSGFAATLSLIAGILLGDIFYILIVLFGLAAIGQILGEFFFIVRILGALYLIYLGITLWFKEPEVPLSARIGGSRDGWKSFLAGFGITLGNPKAILFHLGFLPAFFDLSTIGVVDAFAIIAIFLTVLGGALTGYAYLASRARAAFQDPRKMRILNRGSGALLVGVGTAILVKR
jgi:threonine/homoserine/homoserine lactone efflux protein